MSIVHVKASVNFSDFKGNQSKMSTWVWPTAWDSAYPDDALQQTLTWLSGTLQPEVVDLTNAAPSECLASEIRGFGSATITSGNTDTCYDKLVLDVLTEAGTVSSLEVPAPRDICWGTDGETADLTQIAVSALCSALINANVCDRAGNVYKRVLRGYRSSRGAKPKAPGGM